MSLHRKVFEAVNGENLIPTAVIIKRFHLGIG